jgi:hypothetical protein
LPKNSNKWEETYQKLRDEVKFLPKNITVRIYPAEPVEKQMQGKYGTNTVFVVESNIGKLALNRKQFMEVAERMRTANYPEVGIDYP